MRNKAILILFTVLTCGVLTKDTFDPERLKQPYRADMDMILGEWNITDQRKLAFRDYGQPSSFSMVVLWQEFFSISFFPFSYCQAARLCFSLTKYHETKYPNIVITLEDYCKINILYSPATGKIESHGLTYNNKPADFSGYTDHLTFMNYVYNEKPTYSIMISPKPFSRSASWSAKENKFDNVVKHYTYILTNSRQCQTQVVIDGKIRNLDLITKDAVKDTQMPKMFKYVAKGVDTPTFYTSTELNGKKTADVLPILKTLKKETDKLSVLPHLCRIAAGGIKDGIIKKRSYIRVEKVRNNAQLDTKRNMRKIFVDTIDCHWIRLWFTKKDTWQEYDGKELDQTIDIFFHEGFVLLPDRDNSIQLPGGSREIRKITIDYHGNNLGEISFGSLSAHVLNTISFKMPILDQDTYNIFMIRSPNCDANFGSDAMSSGKFAGGSMIFNEIVLTKCDVRSIE